jgi:glutamate racemase
VRVKQKTQAIGIFDSGVGGLTVAAAVTRLLPQENIIYFGDTAHVPWGDKSTAAIQAYSLKICDMLLQQQCKVILIACNTSSAAAYELVKEYVGDRAMVFDVIVPMIAYLQAHYAHKKLGLIGTRQTINSNVYKKKLDALDMGIQLQSLATPLLVPVIEEGFAQKKFIRELISEYLSCPTLQNIDALILGCTHYPLIKQSIKEFYPHKVAIIDSSEIVAAALKQWLDDHQMRNENTAAAQQHFYVSDLTPTFTALAKLFFHHAVPLERYPLWG